VQADIASGNFLYSEFISQRPFKQISIRRVIGPVKLLRLSEAG